MLRSQLVTPCKACEEATSSGQGGAVGRCGIFLPRRVDSCLGVLKTRVLSKVYIMSNFYWHIEGYDSQDKIYDRKVKLGYFSHKQIQALLKALAAKAGLNFDEIVGAYTKKGTKIANDLLSIHKDRPHIT